MTPKLQTVKDALQRMDKGPQWGAVHNENRATLMRAVNAAGFDPKRAAEDWARYQIAVGEAVDQVAEVEEPEDETAELFG